MKFFTTFIAKYYTNMKIYILTFALIIFLFAGCFRTPATEYEVSDNIVSLMITSKTTEDELNDIAEEIEEKKNIEIDFEESTFRGNGKIKQLELTVNTNDGYKGTASANRSELRVRPMGFIRDYSANAKTPFSIGSIYR